MNINNSKDILYNEVLSSLEPIQVSHCDFKIENRPQQNNWKITGTFYFLKKQSINSVSQKLKKFKNINCPKLSEIHYVSVIKHFRKDFCQLPPVQSW